MHKVLVYKNDAITEGALADLKTQHTAWVDMTRPTKQELEELSRYTDIEAHQIHEWLEGKKRPAAINFKKYSVLIFLSPHEHARNGRRTISTQPCVMLISHNQNDFITIHKESLHAIEEIEQYGPRHKNEMFAKGTTFLLFTLLNEIIEHYHDALDLINDTVQDAEKVAFTVRPLTSLIQQIHTVKKTIIYFHRALSANREVVSTIEHEHLDFIDDTMVREFRILSSSLTQLMEINSTYREILNSSTEIHLAVISNNVNTTMKKVTSWGAIILVPSLIASVFGMNFRFFAAFEWRFGLEVALAAMVLSVVVLYWYFKGKDWL